MNVIIRTILLFLITVCGFKKTSGQSTSWTGTANTNWNNTSNWTNGIPSITKDAILGDANFSGGNQPTVNVAASCKSLTVGGTVATLLSVNKNITVGGDVTINANGTITQKNSTLSVTGNWLNNGIYTTTQNNAKVYFSGVSQFIQGSAVTSFRDLRVSAGSYVTMNVNVDVSGSGSKLEVYGTLDPSESPSYQLTGTTMQVYNSGVLKVKGTTFSSNFSISGSITLNTTGSTVDYASTTINQTVSSSFTYCNLLISGTGIKSLAANLPALTNSNSSRGNILINGGTFDLVTYTANRSSGGGGTLFLNNGAFLKLSGTSNFPVNYATNTLNLASTVEYYGNNQTVSAQTYGHLIFSATSGSAVKTMPGTAFTVGGDFTSTLGTGSSVSYTAASAINFSGDVNIGASTTFNGGSYSHIVRGDWNNAGTFTGSTSTITFDGASTLLTGAGTHNFYNLSFTSTGITGTAAVINVSGNLSTTGAGQFLHNASGQLNMTGTSKSISGIGLSLYDISITGTISSTDTFNVAGNFSVSGTYTGTSGVVYLTGSSKSISGTGSKTFGNLIITGSISTAVDFSIAVQLNIIGSISATTGTATFTGTSLLSGTANLFNVTINGTSLQLAASSNLGIANVFTITAGTLDVTSSIPNSVYYNGTVAQSVRNITYNNLVLSNGNTKTAVGNITVNGNLTISASTTFAGSTYTHTIYKNWINNGTYTASTGTIQFAGSSNSSISGTTTFYNLTINKSTSTVTTTLSNNVTAATVNMTLGRILTGANVLTITTTRTGNGIILGTITRTHSFTTATSYAFEGPYNTVIFSSASGVTSVTVTVTVGTISDFPDGTSINREYSLSVPSGTYSATLRLHYEDAELNGNNESNISLWNFNPTWALAGKAGNSTTNNYVEYSGISNLAFRWTCAETPAVVRWNGSVSSNWNTTANWTVISGSPSSPPSSNDIVQIGTAAFINQPDISSSVTVKGITFGSVQAVTLTLSSGGALTTNGNIAGSWSGNAVHTINSGSQNLTINGSITLSNGVANQSINLSASGGTITILGNLVQKGDASISLTGAVSINIFGDYTYVAGNFSPGISTVAYNGTDEQTVALVPYNNLTINKSSGNAIVSGSLTLGGNLLLSSGQLDIDNSTFTISGNTTINSGSILNCDGVVINAAGNWTNAGTYIATTGTVNLNGTGNQVISAGNFNNLVINKSAGNVTLSGNNSIAQDLTLSTGNVDLGMYTLNRSTNGGTFTMGANTTMLVAGSNNFPASFSNNNLNASSMVHYNGSVSQSVRGVTYGSLQFSNGGSNQKTALSGLTIAGDIAINSDATFNAGSYTINLTGNWTNSGTFVPGTGTLVLNGTSKTITGNSTFNNFTVVGSYTVAGSNITYNGHLQVTITGNYSAGSGTATVSGDLTNRGVLTSTGTTNFTGTSLQTLRLINALLSSSSGIVNFNGNVSPVMNSTSSPQFATLNINNTAGINPSVGWTVFVAMSVNTGATFNGGISQHTVYGSFTNNGTVTSDGSMLFTPGTTKTVALGSSGFSSNGTVEFSGSGQMTITGNPTLFTNVIISNTNAAGISPPSNWSIDSNFVVKSNSIFNAGSYTYTVSGDITSSGTLNGGTSTFNSTSSAGELSASTETQFNHFTVSGSLTPQTDFRVAGNFTNNGTYDGSIGVLIMTGGNAASIGGTTTPCPMSQLQIEKDAGVVVTQNVNLSDVLFLNIFSGVHFTSNRTITQDAGGGILVINDDATLRLGGTNSLPGFSGYGLGYNSNVDYAGTGTQTVGNAAEYGNLLVTTATTKNALVPLIIHGNLLISAGTFATSTATVTHRIEGNFIMTGGSVTGTNSTFEFSGTSDQTLTVLSSLVKVNINKASGNLVLGSNVTATGITNFILGKILLGSYNYTIGTSGSITNNTASKYFIADASGTLVQQVTAGGSKLFPVGTSTFYYPATVALTGSSTTDNFNIRVLNQAYFQGTSGTIVTNNAVKATWVINEAVPGGSNATMTMEWPLGLELPGYNRAFSRLANNTGTMWDYGPSDIAASGSDPYSVSRGGFTSFGPFAVAMFKALPVTWLSISGYQAGNTNIINWSTATETNNNYFVVEASLNGIDFFEIGRINGAVNSSSIQNYIFEHKNVNGQDYYYRIRQVDLDGKFNYSKIIKIISVNLVINKISLYPNPVTEFATLEFILQKGSVLEITVNDISGRRILSSRTYYPNGVTRKNFDVSTQASGIYLVLIADEAGNRQTIQFLKR